MACVFWGGGCEQDVDEPTDPRWGEQQVEGVGTIRDWTGALWNWYGSYWDEGCSGLNWDPDVMNIMGATLESFDDESQYDQAWTFFRAAVDDTQGVPACALSTWDDQGEEFGIDG